MDAGFVIIAALTIASALAAMSLRNLVHCALCLTITFAGLAALYLKLNASKALPSFPIIAELVLIRVITGFLWVYFYLKGGALLVWWLGILLHVRLLFELRPPA